MEKQEEENKKKRTKERNAFLSASEAGELYNALLQASMHLGKDLTLMSNQDASMFLAEVSSMSLSVWQKVLLPALISKKEVAISRMTLDKIVAGFKPRLTAKAFAPLYQSIEALQVAVFGVPAQEGILPVATQHNLSPTDLRQLLGKNKEVQFLMHYVSRRNKYAQQVNLKNPILIINEHNAYLEHTEEGQTQQWAGFIVSKNNQHIYLLLSKDADQIFLVLRLGENNAVNSLIGLVSSVNNSSLAYSMPVYLVRKGENISEKQIERKVLRFFKHFGRHHLLLIDNILPEKEEQEKINVFDALQGVWYLYRYSQSQLDDERNKITRSVFVIDCDNVYGVNARMTTKRNDYEAFDIKLTANNFANIALENLNKTKIFNINFRIREGAKQMEKVPFITGTFSSTGSQESDCGAGNLILVRQPKDTHLEEEEKRNWVLDWENPKIQDEIARMKEVGVLQKISNFHIYSGQNVEINKYPEYAWKTQKGSVIFGDYNADIYAYVGLVYSFDTNTGIIKFLTIAGAGHCKINSEPETEPILSFSYLFAKGQRFFYEESEWEGEVDEFTYAFKKKILVQDFDEDALEAILNMSVENDKDFHKKLFALRNFSFTGRVVGEAKDVNVRLSQIRTLQHKQKKQTF